MTLPTYCYMTAAGNKFSFAIFIGYFGGGFQESHGVVFLRK